MVCDTVRRQYRLPKTPQSRTGAFRISQTCRDHRSPNHATTANPCERVPALPPPFGLRVRERRQPQPRRRTERAQPLRRGYGALVTDATLTITLDDGNVYVDVQCDQGDDMPLVEAIGLLEMAKAILLAPEAGE